MQPGPELDSLVAQHVMEWSHWEDSDEGDYDGPFPAFTVWDDKVWWYDADDVATDHNPWKPSTDWDAAGMVWKKLRGDGWSLELVNNHQTIRCTATRRFMGKFTTIEWHGVSVPHAICLAALRAKGVPTPEAPTDDRST